MVALSYLQRKGALLETTQDTDLNTVTGSEQTPSADTAIAAPSVIAPEAATAFGSGNLSAERRFSERLAQLFGVTQKNLR